MKLDIVKPNWGIGGLPHLDTAKSLENLQEPPKKIGKNQPVSG